MKEELTNLVNEYSWSKSGNDYKKIIEAIEKYDRYIFRLNLEAQRHFDMLMDKIYGKAEIIEEDKPIEKIRCGENNSLMPEQLRADIYCLVDKINELIDEVNKLKKESDK
jgi:hypothetical protein